MHGDGNNRSEAGMRIARLLVLTAASFPSLVREQGIITTLAGADWIFPRTAIHAALAPLGRITFLAVDASGSIYAADSDNHMVVKIAPDRGLTVAAGSGMKGFSGDGGLAVNASLDSPVGVAVAAAGNVFIGDTRNNRVRKVTPDGIIRTVAGTGRQGSGGDGGPATKAALNMPRSLAGVWTGTWNPLNRADRVTADVTALYIGGSVRQGGQASISGRVQAGGGPLLSSAGVVHSGPPRDPGRWRWEGW
jgi:hypothetical protein